MADGTWMRGFEGLQDLAPEDAAALARQVQAVTLAAGTVVFRPGSPCTAYLLVVDGSVRVQMTADTGREIVLYRVRAGESCVLTTSCLLGGALYAAEGIVETATAAVALPLGAFQGLVARSEPFRRFVFHNFGRRLADLLATMQDAVFHRLDGRLARILLDRAEGGAVEATHHVLAVELGSAREVVSRQLKAFERDGLVRLQRGEVRIVDRAGLQAVAERES
ncbi:Crp/Fnr family transcriptional regulator [Prosthecomicrobium sp. N25]|uniref:Crp/Fnr family transcriptional regulator n=1 Tax=Prosthecomicrobium sp. N25 TaxID=3129254 RepID=UPI0030772E7B